MSRYHTTPEGNVAFTDEEETARDAEEKAWADGAATRAALGEIHRLESLETSRRLAESVLTDEGKAWLTANRDKIATERGKL
jgi:hypothetical protein